MPVNVSDGVSGHSETAGEQSVPLRSAIFQLPVIAPSAARRPDSARWKASERSYMFALMCSSSRRSATRGEPDDQREHAAGSARR